MKTVVPFVDLRAQQQTIRTEIDDAIRRVLEDCAFILGPQVGEFERHFADFVHARHAVGVGDGMAALRLALAAVDIGPGDEVILPANTFVATALAVSAVGAHPILVDCDASTYNIDPSLVEAAITARTRAIIPVHLAGQAADMDALNEIAERRGLYVIEDAAQAHGTLYKSKPCGSLGTLACFSFYPSKNLGAYGDGGMVTTSDPRLAERLTRLRDYGQRHKYEHVEKGLNSRLDTLQAAVLSVKLPRLARWNEARAAHADRYRRLLAGIGDVTVQAPMPYSTHIYHLFIVETDHRDAVFETLRAAGIGVGIHYPIPIHLQEAYAELGYGEGSFPHTERLAKRVLSLPMFPELDEDQIDYVVDAIRGFFTSHSERLAHRPVESTQI